MLLLYKYAIACYRCGVRFGLPWEKWHRVWHSRRETRAQARAKAQLDCMHLHTHASAMLCMHRCLSGYPTHGSYHSTLHTTYRAITMRDSTTWARRYAQHSGEPFQAMALAIFPPRQGPYPCLTIRPYSENEPNPEAFKVQKRTQEAGVYDSN